MNFFSGPFWSGKNRHKDFYECLLVFTLKVNISDGEVYHTKLMSTSPLTILYVDDEPLLLQATKHIWSTWDFTSRLQIRP